MSLKRTWQSDAFGQGAPNTDPDQDGKKTHIPLRFPGQIASEGGLYYNYFRDYEPATGRYVQSDPIGLQGGLNTFGYVMGDPVKYVDPFGLAVFVCRQPAFGWMPVDHQWLKTGRYESGMGTVGVGGGNAGNEKEGLAVAVEISDHSVRDNLDGATCREVRGIDENKVDELIKPGQPLGSWVPPVNQCQSFVADVLKQADIRPELQKRKHSRHGGQFGSPVSRGSLD